MMTGEDVVIRKVAYSGMQERFHLMGPKICENLRKLDFASQWRQNRSLSSFAMHRYIIETGCRGKADTGQRGDETDNPKNSLTLKATGTDQWILWY
jgi:hypothetical protein